LEGVDLGEVDSSLVWGERCVVAAVLYAVAVTIWPVELTILYVETSWYIAASVVGIVRVPLLKPFHRSTVN
jgi:hypothetical protein